MPDLSPSYTYSIPSLTVEEPLTANHSTTTALPQLPHNPHTFHRPWRPPCGSHGKTGLLHTLRVPVIQISSSPQLRFRKLSPVSTPLPNTISPQFPLFLSELRVLLVFLYLSLYLSISLPLTCTPDHPHQAQCPMPTATQAAFLAGCSLLAIPSNSENHPGFPRAFYLQDGYNQGDETRPLPVVRKLLYSEGIGRGLES